MKKMVVLAAWLMAVALVGPAAAGPFEDGLDAYFRRDYATALRLWRPLAEQGNARVQFLLGNMYEDGEGVPQDYVQAHKWSNLAASRFPASDKEKHDRAVKIRDLIAAKMTPAQIAEAQKLAREWKPKPEGK